MIDVNDGVTSSNLVLDNEDMYVFSGGIANNTEVQNAGFLFVDAGGEINDTVVGNGGEVDVMNGAAANGTEILTGGYVILYSEAEASGTVVDGGGFTINSGGIASDTTVNTAGEMYVFGGGNLKGSTTVNEGGSAIFEWGTNSTVDVHGGKLILKGGPGNMNVCLLSSVTIDSGGSLAISGGATASSAAISDAQVTIYNSGTLENATLSSTAVEVKNGAVVSNAKLKSGTLMTVGSGSILRDLTVSEGAVLTGVLREADHLSFDGGTLVLSIVGLAPGNAFLVDGKSYSSIGSGTFLCMLTVDAAPQAEGAYNLIEGAAGFNTAITVKDTLGATICTLTVGDMTNIDGKIYTLKLDGTGLTFTIESGEIVLTGDLTSSFELKDGKIGSSVNVFSDGCLNVADGGFVSQTTVNENGSLLIYQGGAANGITVNSGGSLQICAGGTVVNALVNAGGDFCISEGGVAINPTAGANGRIVVSGGIASDTTIMSGGRIDVKNGGELTGNMTFETGAIVSVDEGVVVNFDLTKTTPGADALVNDLSVITGKTTYTLTVGGNQADGSYKLAGGATGFNKTITVKDTLGTTLGTLTVGETTIGGRKYTLTLNGESLGVTLAEGEVVIDTTPPVVSNVAANITEPTNRNVTVTADFSDNVSVAIRAFRLDSDINWQEYPADGVLVTENTTVRLRAIDAAGNVSDVVSYEVTNIDKTLPTITDITPSTTDQAETVTVTATFADNVALAESLYRIGDGDWLAYPDSGVTVTENKTVTFKAVDTAGNEATASYDVTNIGSDSITNPDITGPLDSSFVLSSGMVGNEVNVNKNGLLVVVSGAIISKTIIYSAGEIIVSDGGAADVVTVNQFGSLCVSSGGLAMKVRENGGYVFVEEGANVTFVPNTFTWLMLEKGDRATVHSGTVAENTIIASGGDFQVYSGGIASKTTIATKGELEVFEGGSAVGVTIDYGATLKVCGGGSATGINAEAGAILGLTVAPNTYAQGTYDNTPFEFDSAVSGFTVHSNGWLNVLDGGLANGATIASGAGLNVFEGGSATGIVADDGASLSINVAPGTFVQGTYAGTPFEVASTVSNYTVHSGCELSVCDGGKAEVITVEYKGDLAVSSGGQAKKIRENGGFVVICDGADATFMSNTFSGLAVKGKDWTTVHSGTTAADASITSYGQLLIYEGGLATGATVSNYGELLVYDGGLASGAKVNSGGHLALSGGSATSATVNAYGTLDVLSGLASNATVNSGGDFNVFSGGSVNGLTVNPGAQVYVSSGAKARNVKENGGYVFDDANITFASNSFSGAVLDMINWATVHSGTTATNTTVNNGGCLQIFSSGIASGGAVNAGGEIQVYDGGIASGTVVNSYGQLLIYEGGLATGAAVSNHGEFLVYEGGLASDAKVNADGYLVLSGGSATGATVNANGILNVLSGFASNTKVNSVGYLLLSGGSADAVTVNPGAQVFVYTGAAATNVKENGGYVYDEGNTTFVSNTFSGAVLDTVNWATVHSGTTATNTTVNNGGCLQIFSSGIASGGTVNAGGEIHVYAGGLTSGGAVNAGGYLLLSGGFATGTTVNSGGMFILYGGAEANGFTITSGATLNVYSGGRLTGKMSFKTGSLVYTEEGAMFDFDLTKTSPGADALVDSISKVMLQPFDYTITVDAMQKKGDYKLAKGATDFAQAITVVNTSGTTLGTLTVEGGKQTLADGRDYTLTLSKSGLLGLSIDMTSLESTPPVISGVAADITAPTNQNVTVTAEATDNVQVAGILYKLDNGAWKDYTDGGVVVTENATVYFKAVDTSDNESEVVSIVVGNIDKVAPTITGITPSTTAPAESVIVSAKFADDVGLASRLYRIGDSDWIAYPDSGVTVTENATVTFKAVDTAGNETTSSYAVTVSDNGTVPGNEPANNTLYNKKTKTWNSAENIAEFVVNDITAGDSEVFLDKVGSVDDGQGRHNSLGRTGTVEDAADYAKIELEKSAALTFTVDSTIAGTFYVYQATKDKKGNLVATQCYTISVKANKISPAKTAAIYLEAGEYFVGMETKLPAAKKGDVTGYYSVKLTGTQFFAEGDNGWNDSAYALDNAGKEIKTKLNPELESSALALGRGVTAIKLDTDATGKDGYDNWVGFSDASDYKMLTLENAVNLTMSLSATGKAKLTIWKVAPNAKTGAFSLTNKASVTVKPDKTGTIKAKFLEAGKYFVSVTATDTAKGGGAYYNVSVDPASMFFDSADDGTNNVLYDKKTKTFRDDANFVSTELVADSKDVLLDRDPVGEAGYGNFVGYGDAADYAKIVLTQDGSLSFRITALADVTFELWQKGTDKKGKNVLTSLQKKTSVKVTDYAAGASETTEALTLDAGEYYISVTAKSTKASEKGNAFYNVTAMFSPSGSAADSLAMPETSDADAFSDTSLNLMDSLSLGQFNADALADISSASLAELEDKSAWRSVVSLA